MVPTLLLLLLLLGLPPERSGEVPPAWPVVQCEKAWLRGGWGVRLLL
jgi:hypothetical protein